MAEKTKEPLLLAEKVRLQVLLEQNRAVIENERALLASLGRNEKLNPNIVSAFIGAAVARADIHGYKLPKWLHKMAALNKCVSFCVIIWSKTLRGLTTSRL